MQYASDFSGTITLSPVDGDVANAHLPQLCVSVFSFAFQLRQAADLAAGITDVRDATPMESSGGSNVGGLLDDLDGDDEVREGTGLRTAGSGAQLAGVLKRGGTRMLKPQSPPSSSMDRLPSFTRDEAQLRAIVDELFAELDDAARKADRPQEAVRMCKYALAAFLDELILSSNLPIKTPWLGRPLQLEYFNDFSAGEEFYNKLEGLRDGLRHDSDTARREVLEVYYLCLAFGFCGKFADSEGREKRKVLIDKLARELDKEDAHKAVLSPHALPNDEQRPTRRHWPTWALPVACGGGLLVFYVVLRVILDGSISSLMSAI